METVDPEYGTHIANVKNGITRNVSKFLQVFLIKVIKNGSVHIVSLKSM